jgi:hypothetical protein
MKNVRLSKFLVFFKNLILIMLCVAFFSNAICKPDFSNIKEENGYLLSLGYKIKLISNPPQYYTGISFTDLLPGYNIDSKSRTAITGLYGRGFSFSNLSAKVRGDIMLGVYPSVRQAQESALYYFTDMAAVWRTGTKSNRQIGDNCWYRDANKGAHILFLRNNALVEICIKGEEYEVTENLAIAIDSALITGKVGISISSTSPPSLIQAIEIPTKIHVGETVTIRVQPNVINGKKPKYNIIEAFGYLSEGNHLGKYNRDRIDGGELDYQATKVGKEKLLIYAYDDEFRVSWEEVEIEVLP